MRTLLASVSLLIPVTAYSATPAPKPMAVCINQTTGAVVARSKCKAGEQPLNLGTIAAATIGPKGDPGPPGKIDFSTCYTKTTLSASSLGTGSTQLECDSNTADFMLTDGIESSTIFSFVNARKILFGPDGKVPVGMRYQLNRDTFSDFVSTATIVCCKR